MEKKNQIVFLVDDVVDRAESKRLWAIKKKIQEANIDADKDIIICLENEIVIMDAENKLKLESKKIHAEKMAAGFKKRIGQLEAAVAALGSKDQEEMEFKSWLRKTNPIKALELENQLLELKVSHLKDEVKYHKAQTKTKVSRVVGLAVDAMHNLANEFDADVRIVFENVYSERPTGIFTELGEIGYEIILRHNLPEASEEDVDDQVGGQPAGE